ncbi:MAG: hypothetical protein HYZ54_11140 [Ignavibacteriae bacterium]|nr:hypothetical protein [Ignavibacteriota bacterium]
MDFPLTDILDEDICYQWLVKYFHNGVLLIPYTHSQNYIINDRRRSPAVWYKDKRTGKYFTIFTNTIFVKTHFSACKLS